MVYKTLCVFGTRPEAIKMAPVIKHLDTTRNIQNKVCVTGQHQEMLDSILKNFNVVPDFNLGVMTKGQSLSSLTANILTKLADVYEVYKPDLVLVHGDTTTTLAASLSAYYHHISVAHVEAGLRTGDIYSPWPEEINRKLTGGLASLHFAPTERAKHNLLREGIPAASIHVTGNTVIDALFQMGRKLASEPEYRRQVQQEFYYLQANRKIILVTGHRRESFGAGFERICQALAIIARNHPDVDIVYPVHLNPNVEKPVRASLSGISNIYLIAPVDYSSFVYLMKSAYLILTDSGGIQEEASSLGKAVLLMRDITERQESVDAGVVTLVGTNIEKIVSSTNQVLQQSQIHSRMSEVQNQYGDGEASIRIVNIILQYMNGMGNAMSRKEIEIGLI